jgi:hypothetical protein
MRNSMWGATIALALAACSGGGGGGPVGGGEVPAVAGNYNTTFTATQATGCAGFITAPSMTTETMTVIQSGSSVTLLITNLHPALKSNPVGTISSSGMFHYDGPVFISDPNDPDQEQFSATGTFDGTFSGNSINVGFNFTLATCNVVGTIVGQRS